MLANLYQKLIVDRIHVAAPIILFVGLAWIAAPITCAGVALGLNVGASLAIGLVLSVILMWAGLKLIVGLIGQLSQTDSAEVRELDLRAEIRDLRACQMHQLMLLIAEGAVPSRHAARKFQLTPQDLRELAVWANANDLQNVREGALVVAADMESAGY